MAAEGAATLAPVAAAPAPCLVPLAPELDTLAAADAFAADAFAAAMVQVARGRRDSIEACAAAAE